ncbi:uroporphyrinogen-III C-methyltransferase [Enterococcus phoeniculicola]|jgi:uroporphyrin-III C-methyltransferase|uniref:uroporphyrinogen-III C-methyltransferase n=1 Tax=Enterococcus phoeniculicola ATCC BAA-412 TaxID=1158610 RepID=R3W204_9ENTE|nr:uroporphyrinogen-III C-methyltransferase [Enterococcus phoeniculicola]EOL41702.1 uroporphyrinogen-III C-methyltransferase [Enterococcus phoeniculicola ATCC BAA-412]EOT78804.1 uroporphyrinogen-III C-methyltransferase [Enterococcus phoeniculicola ATCC BAA-412]OJG72637.1 uroporphyrinogen-III C-methyltransferase [Enterococcus phoeniculicola]
MISFVGAGPGDIELVTVKGQRLLENADAVIYDRLANPLLLHYCKKTCDFFYVGKTPYQPSMKQAEINQLLVEIPKKYQRVVRLKGGDPEIFGRLTEELEVVRNEGYLFEIVPGITAASGSAAYSGFSLTKRGIARGVTFLTGYVKENHINQTITLPKEQTLCLYMGIEALKNLLPKLKNIKTEEISIAVIEWGTLGRQRSVFGTTKTIEKQLQDQNIQNPAMILIGEAVNEKDAFPWFENLEKANERILIVSTESPTMEELVNYTSKGADIWWHQVGDTRDVRFDEISQRIRKEVVFSAILFKSEQAENDYKHINESVQ